MASWTDMPLDIELMILDKLPEVIENIRFGATCKSWYEISTEYRQLQHPRRALPMLLVPSPNAPAKHEPPRLYALSSLGQHYQTLRHALPFSRFRYCGSSNGWLATQNPDFTFTLLYPFGSDSELLTIHLPYLRNKYGMLLHDFHISKLIVSPESTPEDYKVVVLFGDLNRVATIRSGETSWSPLDLPNICFADIIFFENKVFGVNNFFAVVEVNIEARPLCCKILLQQDKSQMYMKKTYLVESTSSELFVLARVYYNLPYEDQEESEDEEEEEEEEEERYVHTTVKFTKKFNVYKLKLDERHSGAVLETVESKHLGGDTFFVGDNESMSFPARCFPGCKSDSIYFTDDLIHICCYEPNGPEDVGSYSVEDGTISKFYTMKPRHKRNMPQPIWIRPRYY